MTSINRFKPLAFSTLILGIISLFAITSCDNTPKADNTGNSNSTSSDNKTVGVINNEVRVDTAANKARDAQFVVNATNINLEEIKLGKLAQTNARMADTKVLAKMMVTDHTKALAELTALAQKKMLTVPTDAAPAVMDAYKDLSTKKGMAFDKDYSDKMVNGHKDAIALFEKASNESTDSDIKQWANGMLPGLRMHLEHSLMCQKECDNMKDGTTKMKDGDKMNHGDKMNK